jgi:endoglucanase
MKSKTPRTLQKPKTKGGARTSSAPVVGVLRSPLRLTKLHFILVGVLTAAVGYVVYTAFAATGPLANTSFYINPPTNFAANQAKEWRTSRPADAAQLDKIANRPKAFWMGDWTPDSKAVAGDYVTRATAAGKMGVIVSYNIPSRDCGSYSAGGAGSHASYRSWIDGLAAGIGQRKTAVILEPDAVPGWDCLDAAGKQARIDSLKYAVNKLKTTSQALVYIDAGTKAWLNATEAANRLKQVNIAQADGFALNVSNFFATDETTTYGSDVSGRVGGKHFVIDTSRNGLGSNGQWCNPQGRALGESPTTATRSSLVDAYMWIKGPGESDGACNGAPTAGQWWPEYAIGLAQRSTLSAVPAPTPTTPAPSTPAPTPKPNPTPTPAPVPAPTPTPAPAPNPTAPAPTPTPTNPTPIKTGSWDDQQFTYSGKWQVGPGTAKYKGSDHYSNTAQAAATFTFTGTRVSIYGAKDKMHGNLAISIDGQAETIVNTYASKRVDQATLYTSPALAAGAHTIKMRVVGTKSSAATNTYVGIDRIDITATAGTSVDDTAFKYTGSWLIGPGAAKYGGADHYSNAMNAYLTYSFTGSQVRIYGAKDTMHGRMAVSIDGGHETIVDTYAAARSDQTLLFTTPAVNNGAHTVEVRVLGTKTSASSDKFIGIDRIDVVR